MNHLFKILTQRLCLFMAFFLTYPVAAESIKSSHMMRIKLYFSNATCDQSIEVERSLPKTKRVADLALRTLFKGPSEAEKKRGLEDSFHPFSKSEKGTKPLIDYYLGVSIKNEVAIVNFKEGAMAYLNNTACVQFTVKDPIEMTLKQFPNIKEVQYAIEGEVVEDWDG